MSSLRLKRLEAMLSNLLDRIDSVQKLIQLEKDRIEIDRLINLRLALNESPEPEKICPICQENIEKKDIAFYRCGCTAFHESCMRSAMRFDRRCPCCRTR